MLNRRIKTKSVRFSNLNQTRLCFSIETIEKWNTNFSTFDEFWIKLNLDQRKIKSRWKYSMARWEDLDGKIEIDLNSKGEENSSSHWVLLPFFLFLLLIYVQMNPGPFFANN